MSVGIFLIQYVMATIELYQGNIVEGMPTNLDSANDRASAKVSPLLALIVLKEND